LILELFASGIATSAASVPAPVQPEHGIGSRFDRQIGGIQQHGVAGWPKRCCRSGRVAGVAVSDIAQKTV